MVSCITSSAHIQVNHQIKALHAVDAHVNPGADRINLFVLFSC